MRGSNLTWNHTILYHLNHFPADFVVIQIHQSDNPVSGVYVLSPSSHYCVSNLAIRKPVGQVIIPVTELETSNTQRELNLEQGSSKKKKSINGSIQIVWGITLCDLDACPILTCRPEEKRDFQIGSEAEPNNP